MTVDRRDPEDERLKREFIEKNGVTKIPMKHVLHPPPELHIIEKPKKARERKVTMPTPPSLEEMGPKPQLMWVPVDMLHINANYQRSISTGRGVKVIQEIVSNFRWQMFSVILITPREEGGYWVIDGQHRMTAATHAGIKEVPAMLLPVVGELDQAKIFTGINSSRVNMSIQAIHRARVAAGDEESLLLEKCCKDADVVILGYPKAAGQGLRANETLMVTNLRMVLKRHGPKVLTDILKGIRRDYPTTIGKLNRDTLNQRVARFEVNKMESLYSKGLMG